MSSRRAQKVAEAIREVVSMAILAELNDPRIQDVTVTFVEVSGDLRHAKIHVSVMGDDTKQQLSLRGLQSAAGFLQSRCAARIDTRYTPRIQFILDQGIKKSIEISRILDRVLAGEDQPHVPPAESDDTPANDAERDELTSSQLNRAPPDDPTTTPDQQSPPR